jgi:hypothetical protein
MADDEGVLGNLPKSRPGRRSAKRDTAAGRPSKAAAKAAAKAEAAGGPAAKPPRTAKGPRAARTTAAKGGSGDRVEVRAAYRPEVQPQSPEPSGDPLNAVVRTAASAAATGVRVAGALTQELLRRLPRP